MKNKKLMNVILVILPLAAIVLNALPNAVQMNWMDGNTTYSSGFSMLPVGYGNWTHMLTGVLSAVLVILAAVRCFRGSKKLNKWIYGLSAVAASMPPLASVVFHSMTPASWATAAVLFGEFLLISYLRR